MHKKPRISQGSISIKVKQIANDFDPHEQLLNHDNINGGIFLDNLRV